LIIIKEGLGIDQHRHNGVSLLALDQIIETYRHRQLGLGHIKNLILDVFDVEPRLVHRFEFLDD
jgi:hypothetical protein